MLGQEGSALSAPRIGDHSPWGKIDLVDPLEHGVVFVETPSHGGFWVPQDQLERIPDNWRAFAAKWSHGWGEQWWEEDTAAIGAVHHLGLYQNLGDQAARDKRRQHWAEAAADTESKFL